MFPVPVQKKAPAKIRQKDAKVSLVGNMVSEGTTPRNLTDLIGSLCDLTSGSGDKGTPIVYIQGYFVDHNLHMLAGGVIQLLLNGLHHADG